MGIPKVRFFHTSQVLWEPVAVCKPRTKPPLRGPCKPFSTELHPKDWASKCHMFTTHAWPGPCIPFQTSDQPALVFSPACVGLVCERPFHTLRALVSPALGPSNVHRVKQKFCKHAVTLAPAAPEKGAVVAPIPVAIFMLVSNPILTRFRPDFDPISTRNRAKVGSKSGQKRVEIGSKLAFARF